MKRFFTGLFAIALAGSGLAATASPAMAHDTGATLDCHDPGGVIYTRCGSAGIRVDHRQIITCDDKADDRGVRTHYQLRNGTQGYVGDSNGHTGPCGSAFVGSSSNPIIYFRLCAGVNGSDFD